MSNNSITYNLKQLKKIIFFSCFLLYTFAVFAQKEVIILTEIVTDNARIFSDDEKVILAKKLITFETKTTTQIAVLTINDLQGETIEGYALDVFNKNQLGQKNIDNGILILFSKFDRKVRIEVGYGLESTITDAIASRIIREIMIPNFKEEQYFKGINDASSKIIELINNPELIEEFLSQREERESGVTVAGRIFALIVFTPIFFLLSIFGYNKTIARKNKKSKTSIKKLYKNNREWFFIILSSFLFLVIYFPLFFYKIFGFLFVLSFISIFIFIGIGVIFKNAFKGLVEVFEALFRGKLGIFILPFDLIPVLFFSLGGFVFTFGPLAGLSIFFIQIFLDQDINEFMSNFELIYLLYFVICFFTIFILVAIIKVINEMKTKRRSFGFSLFKRNVKFSTLSSGGSRSGGRRSSYSSSSSSSSSSSFSGGGGSSGGGGASGSW